MVVVGLTCGYEAGNSDLESSTSGYSSSNPTTSFHLSYDNGHGVKNVVSNSFLGREVDSLPGDCFEYRMTQHLKFLQTGKQVSE